MDLIRVDDKGLFCAAGGFHIDPWGPAEVALLTHGHSDHARYGSQKYLCTPNTASIIKHRLRLDPSQIIEVPYGERLVLGNAEISFHPAGHVLGSSQIRVNDGKETWVVTGDYKRAADPSCEAFEVVPCDTIITESTFGLPIYRWQSGAETAREILDWVNSFDGTSVLFCYALGKTQRALAELKKLGIGTVYLHGAAEEITRIYREAGIDLPDTRPAMEITRDKVFPRTLVIAPPSAHRSPWMKRFKNLQTGFASGWMRIRGNKRRRNVERGFVLSDHGDWDELIQTIDDCGAKRVLVTHGQTDVFARYLRESRRLDATPLATEYHGETEAE